MSVTIKQKVEVSAVFSHTNQIIIELNSPLRLARSKDYRNVVSRPELGLPFDITQDNGGTMALLFPSPTYLVTDFAVKCSLGRPNNIISVTSNRVKPRNRQSRSEECS